MDIVLVGRREKTSICSPCAVAIHALLSLKLFPRAVGQFRDASRAYNLYCSSISTLLQGTDIQTSPESQILEA